VPFAAIIAADWAKDARKRVVFAADILRRRVQRVDGADCSFDAVLEQARRWTDGGPVLVAFDVPLGIPKSYLRGGAANRMLG